MTEVVSSPDAVVSPDEEYDTPSFIIDLSRILQITFLIIIIGAISSYFIDDKFSSRSVYDMVMLVCMILCLVTGLMLMAQMCGSMSFAGNRQLLYAMGHKQRLRTYNRELLRRGHLGYVGVIWFSSSLPLVVAFSKWIISGEM
jgi:hypothetical protein